MPPASIAGYRPSPDVTPAGENADGLRWQEDLERVRAGKPVMRCESPSLASQPPARVDGALRFAGWAVSPAGIDSVSVEIEGRGSFAGEIGLRRPDIHRMFHPAAWARRPGFEAAIPTAGWLPGVFDVTLRARDRNGRTATRQGRIAWQPGRAELTSELAAGRSALWVGEPVCDLSDPLDDAVSVRGWVGASDAVESVTVHLEGLEPAHALVGESHYEPDDDIPKAAFAIVLDARELDPRPRALSVRALTRGGSVARRRGDVVVDPASRYRHRRTTRLPAGAVTPAPKSHNPVELHVFVTEGEPQDALLESLAAQDLAPARVTSVRDGLEASLARLLESPRRVGVLASGGDALDPGALSVVAGRFEGDEPPDVLYSDHDARNGTGTRGGPFRKPGWSPELLLSRPYVGSFVAIGSRAAEAAMRADGRLDSANALLLALADEPLRVVREPQVLWSRGPREFTEVSERGDEALHSLAARRGVRLTVTERDTSAGVRRVEWAVERPPPVTIVIPTTGAPEPLSACLRSLAGYPDLEILLVDNGGTAADTAESVGVAARVERYETAEFNFSRACNVGAQKAGGDYVLFLNDDVEALDDDWLFRMLAQAQLPGVGVVGAKLIYPGGLVQHAGLFVDRLPATSGADFVASQFAFHQDSDDMRRLMNLPRECSAVTGACLLMPKDVLAGVGGWDERFRIDFGDVDLCLRAIDAGYRVIVEPRARLLHHVHATQGVEPHDEDDGRRFRDRWSPVYPDGDPWYHPACRFGRDWEVA